MVSEGLGGRLQGVVQTVAKEKPMQLSPTVPWECRTRVVRPDSSPEARICKFRPNFLTAKEW